MALFHFTFTKEIFYRVGFYFLILFWIGLSAGSYLTYKYVQFRLKESIELGAVLMNNKVYEIKERP